MERIEGIKILHVDGLGGGGGGGSGAATAATPAAASPTASSTRRCAIRAQAPLVDQLLREIGIEGGDVGRLARGMLDRRARRAAAAGRCRRTPPATEVAPR